MTATRALAATRVAPPPRIDKQITVSHTHTQRGDIHLHPSSLDLCYLAGVSSLAKRERAEREGQDEEEVDVVVVGGFQTVMTEEMGGDVGAWGRGAMWPTLRLMVRRALLTESVITLPLLHCGN